MRRTHARLPLSPLPAPFTPLLLLLSLSFLFVLALSLSACTQWGTSIFRSVDVWWACEDRHTPCAPDDSALTYTQTENTARAVRRDFLRAEHSNRFTDRDLAPFRLAVMEMDATRARVKSTAWDDILADYVQATMRAERISKRYM
jgi:hypothetical protein